MAGHGAESSYSFCIPDLDESFAGADCYVGTALDPGDAGDGVVGEFTEFVDFASLRVPHVYATSKSDAKHITTSPIHEIEVEVVR